jgi:myosin heavy chain 6/7
MVNQTILFFLDHIQLNFILEMGEQIDQLQKLKNKLEKEKQTVKSELDDLRTQVEHVHKGKAAAEKLSKQLEQQLNEIQIKLEDSVKQINDFNNQKTKLATENSELVRQIEDLEHQVSALQKSKVQLQQQADEAKRALEEETRGKGSVSKYSNRFKISGKTVSFFLDSQIRNLTADLDQAREQLEEESEGKTELQRQVTKLNSEVQQWRSRYESEGTFTPIVFRINPCLHIYFRLSSF